MQAAEGRQKRAEGGYVHIMTFCAPQERGMPSGWALDLVGLLFPFSLPAADMHLKRIYHIG